MRIGLLLPSILTTEAFKNRIFAPRELFVTLVNGLVDKGHEVYVYTSDYLKTKGHSIPGNRELETLKLYSVKDRSKKEDFIQELSDVRKANEYALELVSKTFKQLKENKIELLHSYADFVSYYFLEYTEIPVVFTLHDPVFPTDTFEYWRLKYFANKPHITISNSQKQQYQNLMKLNSVGTVYHGVNLADFEFADSSINDNLLFIGRFVPQKGLIDAINASVKLNKKMRIATSGNYHQTNYYKNEVSPLLKKNKSLIEELGLMDFRQRSDELRQAKATLFPIRWEEPFGLVMIESMACGTPVIAYAQGSTPEIIQDGVTGFLINASHEDVRGNFIIKKTGLEGLCEAIDKIYRMSEKDYKSMRFNCRKHVERKFTSQIMVNNHIKLYEQLLNLHK